MSKVYNNAITTTAGFQFNSDLPLDDRLVVETYADLSSITKYDGMIVYVRNEKLHYKYVDNAWVSDTVTIESIPDSEIIALFTS